MKIFLPILAAVALTASQVYARDPQCYEDNGFFPDDSQCDAYYNCVNGTATWELCPDGLGFLFYPYYKGNIPRCDFLIGVDCGSRGKLQAPIPTPNCPRQWGLYPHENDCNKFWYCVDGVSYDFNCPPSLAFNEETGNCDYPRYVSRCTEPEYPVQCPRLNELARLFNPHPLLADQDNCRKFYICMNGKYPRHQGCPPETLYNPYSKVCENASLVDCGSRPIINEEDEEEYNANELRTQGRSRRIQEVEETITTDDRRYQDSASEDQDSYRRSPQRNDAPVAPVEPEIEPTTDADEHLAKDKDDSILIDISVDKESISNDEATEGFTASADFETTTY